MPGGRDRHRGRGGGRLTQQNGPDTERLKVRALRHPGGGAFDNTLLLIACAADEVERVVEAVRPVLARRGGMCLVSDAAWVRH